MVIFPTLVFSLLLFARQAGLSLSLYPCLFPCRDCSRCWWLLLLLLQSRVSFYNISHNNCHFIMFLRVCVCVSPPGWRSPLSLPSSAAL